MKKRKATNNQILGFGVLVLSAVVLVKLFDTSNKLGGTADEWKDIAEKINDNGLKSLL